MAEAPVIAPVSAETVLPSRFDSAMSVRAAGGALRARWRLAVGMFGGLLLATLMYCLVAPRQYEARARLELRVFPVSALHFDAGEDRFSGSLASGQVQLETQADVLRSDELAWRVILDRKLYDRAGFAGDFRSRFAGFQPAAPTPEAQALLLERFQRRLQVRTIPVTLLMDVRFRCGDAALSAEVVDALLRAYGDADSRARVAATAQSIGPLEAQLQELKARSDGAEARLLQYQRLHGLLVAPDTVSNGQAGDALHVPALAEADDMGKDLVAASSDRILREAEYRAALAGDPELVLASDERLEGETGNLTAGYRQLRARKADLEQEKAQLSLEHGPNFPRMQEIRKQLQEIDGELRQQDARLREEFKSAWQTAAAREDLARKELGTKIAAGQGANEALAQYESMRSEAAASHELYLRMQGKLEEAQLTAPARSSPLEVVDAPRVPAKPVTPDLPLYLLIAGFAGAWLALGGALLMESIRPSARVMGLMLVVAAFAGSAWTQAPTPSTSGLPTGVARIAGSKDAKAPANPNETPRVWTGAAGGFGPGAAGNLTGALPGMIIPGDMLDVTEYHTPEFHSTVRVSAAGAVLLPMIGEVNVNGLDEAAAARAVEAMLLAKGILLHPQVSVLVTVAMGQDVSVLGEVGRPGVYPYGVHHRMLDAISAAAGLTPTAGSVVRIEHRSETEPVEVVALVQGDAAVSAEHNPELLPGDTVLVSRTGLVYVVGDVLRPGGFAMEPDSSMTVLRALSLAWGPSMNASLKNALLIRERNGGRTVTSLNLKRMLHGQDPDLPIEEHDIVYVPDSAAKNLWNRTVESVVQSAAGVSIYAGMVYSQRF